MSRAELLLPSMEDQVPEEVRENFIVHGNVPKGYKVTIDRGVDVIVRDPNPQDSPQGLGSVVSRIKDFLSDPTKAA